MNQIINPLNGESYYIFSKNGTQLLRYFIKQYQSGGTANEPLVAPFVNSNENDSDPPPPFEEPGFDSAAEAAKAQEAKAE